MGRQPEPQTPDKETTMNAFLEVLYRDLTCALGAAAISLILAASFVQSTAVPPGMNAQATVVPALPVVRA
jgi:hypothetical protein